MKLVDLYERVVETTGLDVMTIGSLKASIANCMADLTSRGYRIFKEVKLSGNNDDGFNFTKLYEDNRMLVLNLPTDIRKVLYLKVFFAQQAGRAERYSVSNPKVQSRYIDGKFRTQLGNNGIIFYIKGDQLVVEWDARFGPVSDLVFGYYARLIAPQFDEDVSDIEQLQNVDIPIRKEFEDALVFYSAYFYYSRYVKDTEKIQLYLNNYKYYVEDITHELAYEDEYYEDDAVVHEEY